jgi:hypothetical protein
MRDGEGKLVAGRVVERAELEHRLKRVQNKARGKMLSDK